MKIEKMVGQLVMVKRVLRNVRTKRTTVRNNLASMDLTPRQHSNLNGQVLAYTSVVEYLKPMVEDLMGSVAYEKEAEEAFAMERSDDN